MVWIPDHIWYGQKGGKGKGWGGGGGKGNHQVIMTHILKALVGADSSWGGSGSKGWGGGKGKGKGKGGGDRSKKSFSGDFVKGELISKIKDFQRSSDENKQAWWDFCDGEGGGNRDPARHEADVLQAFLAGHGIQTATKGNSFVKGELVHKLKSLQSSNPEIKQAWWDLCDTQEGQKRDPALYDVDFLQNFLSGHGIVVPTGTPEQKAALVGKIKAFQKSGEVQKQTWWSYCDDAGAKKRDPALHDTEFLENFVNANGL